jgi:hypothetical protein
MEDKHTLPKALSLQASRVVLGRSESHAQTAINESNHFESREKDVRTFLCKAVSSRQKYRPKQHGRIASPSPETSLCNTQNSSYELIEQGTVL